MSSGALITSAAAGAVILGAGWYLARRGETRPAMRGADARMIPIISPVIDLRIAEAVLEVMEHNHGDQITVLLHTQGGCVASCVLISNALRQYPNSTAVVPYMAISGGTMIALNAKRLEMGRNAALSAVDPIISGMRARHLRVEKNDGGSGRAGQGVPYGDRGLPARDPRGAPARRVRRTIHTGDARVHG
jgi:hypothetical protein